MANGHGGARAKAGRKAGVPNKRSRSVQEMLDAKGCNPIEAMADVLLEAIEDKDTSTITHVASILAPYHSPKLTSSKIEGEITGLTYEEKLKLLAANKD